ncbi:MAG: dipeptidase [Acidobacteriota bacterium]|nr:dipeptidase [Acidobacteriota bacterium]
MSFHDDCLVLDGHTDVPLRLWESPADLGLRLADRQVDLPRLRQGGVDALVFALYIPAILGPEAGLELALTLHRIATAHLVAGLVAVAGVEELRRTVGRGAVAVLFGLENGRPLLVPGALERCQALGVRYVTLTHMRTHEWCDASTDAAAHGGLSPRGVELVREMNRRGILPDLSHASDDAVRHVLEVSAVPVLASHSSARARCDHPRNLPDELIREIGRGDGLVMANSYPSFVDPAASHADGERFAAVHQDLEATEEAYLRDPQRHWQERRDLLADHPMPAVPLAAYVDHVVHLIEQAGEEHVGIGTDFDGIPEVLTGFEDVSRFPDLTAALLARGVDRAGVRLILGENFLRLLGEAERYAG